VNLFHRFYHILPVRAVAHDEHLHLLNEAESRQIRRSQGLLTALAALLSIAGFLAYYLPVYWFPRLFPAAMISIPGSTQALRLAWAELLWAVLLTTIEIVLLTLLNITGVHEIALATGFLNAANKSEKTGDLMQIGLEKKATEITQYGIDPFQGLSEWMILLFNFVLRLKGWFGNQAIRYVTRVLLGRYAVRAVLDFAGLPLYMAINAYSIQTVMREAKVIIMGRTIIGRVIQDLPPKPLPQSEQDLLYDALQYIAVSKRDFHQNHYLLTKELLESFQIPAKTHHPLPADFLAKLARSEPGVKSLCQIVILLGFILDGHLSWRERSKLRDLNEAGILNLSLDEMNRCLRDFLHGRGVDRLLAPYLQIAGSEIR
jgi:hypothetical protein